MALRRTVRRKTREQGELEHYRDHEARLYVRERGSALLQIAAGATPYAGARQGVLKPRAPDTLYGWLEIYADERMAGLVAHPQGETAGGYCAEVGAVQEELVETRRAGPGEAARREVVGGAGGPAPSRWTLRTLRAAVDRLTDYMVSGVRRLRQRCGLGLHTARARVFSPAPEYQSKVRRPHRCLRDAARHPDAVVAVCLDEFGYPRGPEVTPPWGVESAGAQRAGNNQHWRTSGALTALTGQVNSLEGDLVARQHVIQFYSHLERTSPAGDLIYVSDDNWNIYPHPDVLPALED